MDGLSYYSRGPQRRTSIDTFSNATMRLKVLFAPVCASMGVLVLKSGVLGCIIILGLQKVNATYPNKNLMYSQWPLYLSCNVR